MLNATVGTASIGLRANTRQFERGLQSANRNWQRFINQMTNSNISNKYAKFYEELKEKLLRGIGEGLGNYTNIGERFLTENQAIWLGKAEEIGKKIGEKIGNGLNRFNLSANNILNNLGKISIIASTIFLYIKMWSDAVNKFKSSLAGAFPQFQGITDRIKPVADYFKNLIKLVVSSASIGALLTPIFPLLGFIGGGIAGGKIAKFSLGMQSLNLEFKLFSQILPQIYQKLQPIIQQVKSFVSSTMDLGGRLTQIMTSYKTLLGDFQGENLVRWIQNYADITPFDFEGLANSTRQMLMFGFSINQAQNALQLIGDTVAATSGSMENVDRIATVFGRTLALNRAYTRNIQMLVNDGFNAWQALSEYLGISVDSVMDKVRRGLIDGGTALNAWFAYMQNYAGGMSRLSHTMLGMTETIKDEWLQVKMIFSENVLEPLIKPLLATLIGGIRVFQGSIIENKDKIIGFFNNLGFYFKQLMGYIISIPNYIKNGTSVLSNVNFTIKDIIHYVIMWHNYNIDVLNTIHKIGLNIGIAFAMFLRFQSRLKFNFKDAEKYNNIIEDLKNKLKDNKDIIPKIDEQAFWKGDYWKNINNNSLFEKITQERDKYLNQNLPVAVMEKFTENGKALGDGILGGLQEVLSKKQEVFNSMQDTVTNVIDKMKENFRQLKNGISDAFKEFENSISGIKTAGADSWAIFGSNKNNMNEQDYMTNPYNISQAYDQILNQQNAANAVENAVGRFLFGDTYNNLKNEVAQLVSDVAQIKDYVGAENDATQIQSIPLNGYGFAGYGLDDVL